MKKAKISDIVKTRELHIYDDNDRLRISLAAYSGVEPKIIIHRENGSPGLQLSILEQDSDSQRIAFFGESYQWRMIISASKNGAGFQINDDQGRPLASWIVASPARTADSEKKPKKRPAKSRR